MGIDCFSTVLAVTLTCRLYFNTGKHLIKSSHNGTATALYDNKLQKLKALMPPSSVAPMLCSIEFIRNSSSVITVAIYFTGKPRAPACANTRTMYDNGAQIMPKPYFQSALKLVASG